MTWPAQSKLCPLEGLTFNQRPKKEIKLNIKAVTSQSAGSGMLASFLPGTPKEGAERSVCSSYLLRTNPPPLVGLLIKQTEAGEGPPRTQSRG